MADILAGRVALVPQGEWSITKEYKRLDVVLYGNSSYICKKDNVGNQPQKLNEYWQLLAQSSEAESFPRIDLEIGFYTSDRFDKEHIKLHNYQYYIDKGYKLTVFRKGRYKIKNINRYEKFGVDTPEGALNESYRYKYYGWKATVIKETEKFEEFPYYFKHNLGWEIQFLTVNDDGIVCFESGKPLIARDVVHVHKAKEGIGDYFHIASPCGRLRIENSSKSEAVSFQKYGLAFVDTTNYIPSVTRLWEKSCVSNIASFRGFCKDLNGSTYFRK